jgi:hypothetical protein
MKKHTLTTAGAALGVLALLLLAGAPEARAQAVFQAAGPDAASIEGTVNAFRAALGEPNNANNGPQPGGRREINWDGGGAADNVTPPVTPFDVFLQTRGARFTTPGTGLSQAPVSGGPQNGLVGLFNNPTYADAFSTFSPLRLFTPVGSRITDGQFFLPGSNGGVAATVTGFGAVFSDVDKPDGVRRQGRSTRIRVFDAAGNQIFTSFVPAAPGDRGLSVLGVVFPDARIARVRIQTGDTEPGPDDDGKDIVMMDDFLYGEPQASTP